MVDEELGEATIVYEDPDDGTVEKNVQNEHIAYFQDHWLVKVGEDDEGRDVVRRIPATRVYHVERTVERFEEEVKTIRDQVQSFTDDLRSRLLGGGDGSDEQTGPLSIDVENENHDDNR
ncbi:hypothetical protein [Haloprofundus salilacus]|uniref:hypothetical protein n=1 Tax=Haloprofundus salilacus TaxID=2876190 RepID=UPI001CC928F8|nr:hypothetical protein [Haloprofundus salilacus]